MVEARAAADDDAPRLLGVDFTSAPSRRKPIAVVDARLRPDGVLAADGFEALTDFDAFDALLARPGPWVGAFDLPFGLPRALLATLGWPHDGDASWARATRHVASLTRAQMVTAFRAFCDARPAGGKFAHRATDGPAGSSPSMKWVNPPVAFMLHAGAPRLLSAGVHLPGLHAGDPARVALEAYPGLLARAIVGRASYKSDDAARRTEARRDARAAIVTALEAGRHPMACPVELPGWLRERCIDEGGGDTLDALLCAVQAAWAWQRRATGWGLPPDVDPVEGWIVGAAGPADATAGG